jgi:branched-chain amino acid transport system permease protein
MLGAYAGWIILTHLPRDPAWFALGVLGTAPPLAIWGPDDLTLSRPP